MSARDDLRRIVHAATADMWTAPTQTDERTDRLYAAIRAEILNEAADAIVSENDRKLWASKPGKHWAADLLRAMASPGAASVPVKTADDEPGEAVECTCMPHRKLPCGHCAMDICEDCHNCPCGCDCAEGGE